MPLHDVSKAPENFRYIGYNVAGGTAAGSGSNTWTWLYKQVSLERTAFLASIDAYVKGNGAQVTSLYAGVAYDSSGAPGNPASIGNFPGEVQSSANPLINFYSSDSTPRWCSVPIGAVLPAGLYWLVVVYGGSGTASAQSAHYDAGGSDYSANYNNTWFAPAATSATNSSRNYSIRAAVLD